MNGYKTIITAVLSVLGGVATMMGVTLDPQLMADIAANLEIVIGGGMVLYGALMSVLRAFTSSPMFNGKSPGKGSLNNFIVPLFLVGMMLGVTGCSIKPKVETPTDMLAVAVATTSGIVQTVEQRFKRGAITRAEKNRYVDQLRSIKTDIELASLFIDDGLPDDAVQALLLINQSLLVLQSELQKQIEQEQGP